MTEEMNVQPKVYRILLLTNRDSDNVGDQVIEACDISLISTIMMNLGLSPEDFVINSRAAAIVSKKYLQKKDPELLNSARKAIQECDLIIFGGAPVFNYLYQNFYERTAVTLELAKEYNKPVIFSAIGIDGYHEDNQKCQRLKETLNFDCVRQITTRDDFQSLQKYRVRDHIFIEKVSDPAVFASKVFEKYTPNAPKTNYSFKARLRSAAKKLLKGNHKSPDNSSSPKKKKIGLFILRAHGFKDNGINLTKHDSALLWKGIIEELEEKQYDYELITSGHFGDEAFLDYLIRNYNVKEKKCVFNINFPEKLIQKISSYDAIISCRLHPSIIAFSLGVPAIGLIWNSKVKYFYESIGYTERLVDVKTTSPAEIVSKAEAAISQGIVKDKNYLASVYNSLFKGIQQLFPAEKSTINPYSYDEIIDNMPLYGGTSAKEKEEKLKRKFRRVYEKYNNIFDENQKYRSKKI